MYSKYVDKSEELKNEYIRRQTEEYKHSITINVDNESEEDYDQEIEEEEL
jgi:hypothetical protein